MMRCLYVDDEEGLLEIAKDFLEQEGDITVDTVSSAKTALDLLSNRVFDAIISDYQMPEMDGIDFLKRIRSDGMDTPFILFTGRGREEVVIDALRNGADHYIKKGGEAVSQYAELANMVRQTVRRKEAEWAMRHSAVRFRALIENSRDLVIIIDGSGFISYASPSTKNSLGYTTDEVKGRNVFEFLHPDDTYIKGLVMKDVRNDKGGLPIEFRLRAKDRGYRWFKGSATAYLDERKTSQTIAYAWFIDDWKRAERELAAWNKAYQEILEQLEEMVFMLDETGRFLMVNGAACKFLGRTRDSLVGISITDTAAPSDRDIMLSVLTNKLGGCEGKPTNTYKVLDAEAREKEIEVTSRIIMHNGLRRVLGVAVPRARSLD